MAILIIRSMILAATLFLYFKVKRETRYDWLIYWFTGLEIFISMSFIYISNLFPNPNILIQAFGVMIIILAIFLINNRLRVRRIQARMSITWDFSGKPVPIEKIKAIGNLTVKDGFFRYFFYVNFVAKLVCVNITYLWRRKTGQLFKNPDQQPEDVSGFAKSIATSGKLVIDS